MREKKINDEEKEEKEEKIKKKRRENEEKKKTKSELTREKKKEVVSCTGNEAPYPLVPSKKDKERHFAHFLENALDLFDSRHFQKHKARKD